MKTAWLSLFLFLSFATFAQDDSGLEEVNGVGVYFKAGGNAANFIDWDDEQPTEMLMGLSGGMGVWIRLGKPTKKTLAMAIEGNFSGQGFQTKVDEETYKVRTTYFNAGLTLRQYFGHFYVTGGAEHGWLINATQVVGTERTDFTEGIFKKTAWNGIGGLGINFGGKYSRQVDFGLEATYRRGLGPVRTDFVKARHSVFNLSLFIPVSIVAEIASAM